MRKHCLIIAGLAMIAGWSAGLVALCAFGLILATATITATIARYRVVRVRAFPRRRRYRR